MRKKVEYKYIENRSARKACFRKRKEGLIKKVRELATLCDVEAGIIIYGQDEDVPTVWPSKNEACNLLQKFMGVTDSARHKRMQNQESYLVHRVQKLEKKLRKDRARNKEALANILMHQLQQGRPLESLDQNELQALMWFVEQKEAEVYARKLCIMNQASVAATPHPQIGASQTQYRENTSRNDQWFNDIIKKNEASSSNMDSKRSLHENPSGYPRDLGFSVDELGGPSRTSTMSSMGYLSTQQSLGGPSGIRESRIEALPHGNAVSYGSNFVVGAPAINVVSQMSNTSGRVVNPNHSRDFGFSLDAFGGFSTSSRTNHMDYLYPNQMSGGPSMITSNNIQERPPSYAFNYDRSGISRSPSINLETLGSAPQVFNSSGQWMVPSSQVADANNIGFPLGYFNYNYNQTLPPYAYNSAPAMVTDNLAYPPGNPQDMGLLDENQMVEAQMNIGVGSPQDGGSIAKLDMGISQAYNVGEHSAYQMNMEVGNPPMGGSMARFGMGVAGASTSQMNIGGDDAQVIGPSSHGNVTANMGPDPGYN